MGDNWSKARIEVIAEKVACGPFGSSIKVSTFVNSGVPVISGQHLHGTRLQDGEYNFITSEHADKLSNANVYPGDIVFTHAGNIGQAAVIPDTSRYKRYVLSQRQFYLRPDRSIIAPEFVAYYFHSPPGRHKLLANTSQTGVPSIARPVSYLKSIEIPIPPFPEQRAIAHILGSLDDKIELNRRMNETLESMARAIFKSWFVNFDPVHAKAEGRDTGLPEEIAALFPDSFEDSELGRIPSGWVVKKIGYVTEFAYGKALKVSDRQPGNIPVFGSNGLVGFHNEALVNGPGIIIGRKGNPGIVTWTYNDFFPIDTTFYVKRTGIISSLYYLFYALKAQNLPSLSADSAVPGLNRNLAYMNNLLIPSENVLSVFDEKVEPLFQKIQANSLENDFLTSLRDTFLPKLISGELRVPDAEKLIEEAGL